MMVWAPLDSGGFGLAIGTVATIGFIVGSLWLRRIATLDEDPDRSFTRLSGRRGGGSRLPDAPGIPMRGWLLTRGAIVIGLGAIAFAVVAPQIMRRWNPAFEAGGIAILLWILAILAAVVGTAWMIRIAVRGPEDGAPGWRSRR